MTCSNENVRMSLVGGSLPPHQCFSFFLSLDSQPVPRAIDRNGVPQLRRDSPNNLYLTD